MFEILSPAGDTESFDAALKYGADAVYVGLKDFTMRQNPKNFNREELSSAVKTAHELGKKVYLTLNTLPRNADLGKLDETLEAAENSGIDALIVADTGVFSRALKTGIDIHMSTQTGIVNYEAARFFCENGAKRIVLARELSLEEIAEIRAKTPSELELETFVHGAMCVSFSGRCLLSAYLTGRDANRGECAQPCRWGYKIRPESRNASLPIFEDESGTYILNAKDLCMIEHLAELEAAGVNSIKIEGRAKSAYYTAIITNAYRKAVSAHENGENLPDWVRQEVEKVSHRAYCTGFYFGGGAINPKLDNQHYGTSSYIREWDVVAVVDGYENGEILATQRNRFFPQQKIEVISPNSPPVKIVFDKILDENGAAIPSANKAMMKLRLPCAKIFEKGSYLRCKNV